MPILIPAKNIYSIKYEKNVDNAIHLIQVKSYNYKIELQDKSVYGEYTTSGWVFGDEYEKSEFKYGEFVDNNIFDTIWRISRAYAYIKPYTYSAKFTVPKDKNKEFITQLSELNFDAICEVRTGTVTAKSVYYGNSHRVYDLKYKETDISTETVTQFPVEAKAEVDDKVLLPATAIATIPKDVSETKFEIEYRGTDYLVTVSFVCGGKTVELTTMTSTKDEYAVTGEFDMSGTYKIITPKQLNISINGISQVVTFEEVVENYGNTSSKNAIIIGENNELIQTTSMIALGSGDNVTYTPHIETFQTILEDYKNGKKKLILVCDINNYYYYDDSKPDKKGDIVISRDSSRLTFEEYDQVIPMIKKADGSHVPIDKNADGTPMVFVVLAIRFYYDGVVWQELTLQQK